MTSREQFLVTFHLSDYLAQLMEDYRSVLSIMRRAGEVGVAEGDQFIHCVAGVIACLMGSGDREVVRGLEYLGEHMDGEDPHALTDDPIQFYCNKKAVFYIARPYLYCFSDLDLHLMLLRDRYQYPGLPDDLYPYGFWYWIRYALEEYKKYPGEFIGKRDLDGWVEDSFPSPAVHKTWLAGYQYRVSFDKAKRKDRTSYLYTAPPMTEADEDIRRLLEVSCQEHGKGGKEKC